MFKIQEELSNLIKTDISADIVLQLMQRFDEEIITLEDPEDPMKPSLFRDEFESFLKESISKSVVVSTDKITFGVGDTGKLGFERELDENTTDGLRIIGTIIQGIMGEYVLVTVDMARKMFYSDNSFDLGRTGRAYLMQKEEYNQGVANLGWEPKNVWRFSNFPGVPDFFDKFELNLDEHINKLIGSWNEKNKI